MSHIEITDDILKQSNAMLDQLETQAVDDDLSLSIADMQYPTFNRIKFMGGMWAMAIRAGIKQEDFIKTINTMACLGLMRGNNLEKLRNRSSEILKESVERWIKIYNLVDKPSGPMTVTLLRVTVSLAMVISKSLDKDIPGISGTIRPEQICDGFPRGMAFFSFGVLVPTDIEAESLALIKRAFYYHQYVLDRTIHSGTKKFLSRDDIMKYANIQISSDMHNNQERYEHCANIGVLSIQDGVVKLTPAARPGVEKAANLWDATIF